MKKFIKLVVENRDEFFTVYDEEYKYSIDIFPNDEQGKDQLLEYFQYLLTEDQDDDNIEE